MKLHNDPMVQKQWKNKSIKLPSQINWKKINWNVYQRTNYQSLSFWQIFQTKLFVQLYWEVSLCTHFQNSFSPFWVRRLPVSIQCMKSYNMWHTFTSMSNVFPRNYLTVDRFVLSKNNLNDNLVKIPSQFYPKVLLLTSFRMRDSSSPGLIFFSPLYNKTERKVERNIYQKKSCFFNKYFTYYFSFNGIKV